MLGVIKAFENLHWQVSSYIVGDRVPLGWVTGSFDQELVTSRSKRIAADILRLLFGVFSGWAAARKCRNIDWVYERAGSFQHLGSRCKKKGIPWILETNALLYLEAFMDRKAVFFNRLAKKEEIKAYQNCDALICVTDGLKARIVAATGINPGKVVVVPNGVDIDFFNPDIAPVKRFFNEPTIGFVGTMYPWQGLDLLLSVLADLSRDGFGFKLVLVGDGPALADLRRQTDKLRLSADVCFTGRIEWHDIPSHIAGFDIGYSGQIQTKTGDWYGSPIKIYEFMAMRIPVIASAFEDASRALTAGQTGYLFPPGDPAALKELLKTAFAERKKWPEMGRLARNEVERSYSWTARVRTLIPRLEQILQKNEVS